MQIGIYLRTFLYFPGSKGKPKSIFSRTVLGNSHASWQAYDILPYIETVPVAEGNSFSSSCKIED